MADPWEGFEPVAMQKGDPWAGFEPVAAPKDKPLSWADVPGKAVANIPESAGRFVGGIYDAVTSPVQTAGNLADLGAGAIRAGAKAVLPAGAFETIDAMMGTPETNARISNVASAAGTMLADRYGSAEGLKKTLAEDPVGVAADASMLLTGGGSSLARAPGVAGRAGQAVQAAGRAIDPIMAAGRGVALAGRGGAELLGVTTGVGARPIQEAYRAGREGNAAFTDAMRGNTTAENIVDMGERGVEAMGRERSAAYTANMAGVKSSAQPVNIAPVFHEIQAAKDKTHFNGIPIDQKAADIVQQIHDVVDRFNVGVGPNFTPAAFDAMKRSIGEIYQRTQQGTLERKVAGDIYNAVKGEITKQVPEYAKAMKGYSEASDQIGEMRRTLSLNDRASTDTTARKLLSSMRNNVNANFGERERLVNTLAQAEPDLVPALAGMTMNALAPRGLARISPMTIAAGGIQTMNPAVLALMPTTSPRLVGEAAYATGRGAGLARDAVAALPQGVQQLLDPQAIARALLAAGVTNRLATQE